MMMRGVRSYNTSTATVSSQNLTTDLLFRMLFLNLIGFKWLQNYKEKNKRRKNIWRYFEKGVSLQKYQLIQDAMKYCKRMFLVLVAILATTTVTAQNLTFTSGKKPDTKCLSSSYIHLQKGLSEGRYYAIEPNLNPFGKTKHLLVREVDINFKEYQSLEIENTKGCEILYDTRDGDHLHFVFCNNEKTLLTIRHVDINLSSFTIENDEQLVNIELPKRADTYIWTAASTSENYFGLIYGIQNDNTTPMKIEAMLFNRSIKRQWTQQPHINVLSEMFVTDDGRIITGGYFNNKDKSGGNLVEFNLVTPNSVKRTQIHSEKEIGQLALLNCFGNKLIATALETDRGFGHVGSFLTPNFFTRGMVATGCVAYLCDVENGEALNISHYNFTKEDKLVFFNADLLSRITSPNINFLCLRASTATPQGGAALYGRSWQETDVYQNKGKHEWYVHMGMMVVNVDSLGNITWTRGIMHDNFTDGTFERAMETDMVYYDGNLYVLTNESKHEPDTYSATRPAIPATALVGAAIVVGEHGHNSVSAYIFSPEGNVRKQKLETPAISIITTPLQYQGDGIYYLMTGHTGGRLSEFTIRP